MFATRTDQENLAYSHQQAAASKPLNQGAKGLESKTPANKQFKTPFRGNKQDENNVFLNGKTGGGKGKQQIFTTVKKGNGLDKDAFVTPAGPRTRAPLGMKTTNVKVNSFQTPAFPTNGNKSIEGAQKPISPRLRRAKVKIHQAEATTAEPIAEPEIEYMPPKSTPLPDYPDDLDKLDFSTIFNRDTMIRDLFAHYANPLDKDGVPRSEREFEKMMAKADNIHEETMRKALAADRIFGDTAPFDGTIDKGPRALASKGLTTVSSKTAAAALSRSVQPRFAAPTVATKARAPSAAPFPRKANMPLGNKSTNHAVASAASRSTLGYSKGRAISASARKPLSQAHQAEVIKRPAASQQPKEQKRGLDYLLAEDPELDQYLTYGSTGLEENEASVDEMEDGLRGLDLDEQDEALEDFELEMPESE